MRREKPPGGFRVHDVPGDGNCCYTSMSLAMNDFRLAWSPEDITVVKQKMLRRLLHVWREVADDDMESLDADIQVVLRDEDLAERLSTEFSWAETSEIILASRFFKVSIYVWVLYPRNSESMLALAVDPPGWPSRQPIHLWNIITENGRGDHYCALEPALPEPHPFLEAGSSGLIYAALSLGCLAGLAQAISRAQR